MIECFPGNKVRDCDNKQIKSALGERGKKHVLNQNGGYTGPKQGSSEFEEFDRM